MGKERGLRKYKGSRGGVQREDEYRSKKVRNAEYDRGKGL